MNFIFINNKVKMSKSITYWKLSQRCTVFPHLEFGKLYTFKELKTIAETLKKDLEDKNDYSNFQ